MPIIKNPHKHTLLFDTHVLIWVVTGDTKLSPSFKKIIKETEINENILLSPISIWEIGMLEAKGRLQFDLDCQDWVEAAINHHSLSIAPITPKIAINSSRLPGEFHGDPADRLLVSTAYELRAVFVTADEKILHYASKNKLNVINPTA